jgi:hypothetical protein
MIKMILCCMFRQDLENSNMNIEISTSISFHIEVKTDNVKDQVVPKSKK